MKGRLRTQLSAEGEAKQDEAGAKHQGGMGNGHTRQEPKTNEGVPGRGCQGQGSLGATGEGSPEATSWLRDSYIHSLSLCGVWFEDLGGVARDIGRWPQGSHLAGTVCSRTSSLPHQLFPNKCSFISEHLKY